MQWDFLEMSSQTHLLCDHEGLYQLLVYPANRQGKHHREILNMYVIYIYIRMCICTCSLHMYIYCHMLHIPSHTAALSKHNKKRKQSITEQKITRPTLSLSLLTVETE